MVLKVALVLVILTLLVDLQQAEEDPNIVFNQPPEEKSGNGPITININTITRDETGASQLGKLYHDMADTGHLGKVLQDMADTNQDMLNAVLLGQVKKMQGQLEDLQSQIKNLTIDNCRTKKACCNKTITCPSGYEWFCEKPDTCYKFPTDYNQYAGARSACSKFAGGRLAMPKDKATQEFLIDKLYKKHHVVSGIELWIGLTDQVKEGTWVWEDGTPLGTGWNNWSVTVGILNSATADCGIIDLSSGNRSYKWYSTRCEYVSYYICEVKATAAP